MSAVVIPPYGILAMQRATRAAAEAAAKTPDPVKQSTPLYFYRSSLPEPNILPWLFLGCVLAVVFACCLAAMAVVDASKEERRKVVKTTAIVSSVVMTIFAALFAV